MQIIISHLNTDFDALASMTAAKKLYPDAQIVISDKQTIQVQQFLTIYRDMLDLQQDRLVDWNQVTEMIVVDVAILRRLGPYAEKIDLENVKITIYDHHPRHDHNLKGDIEVIEPVGAAVTLLIEEIKARNIALNAFEATLLGLGIYSDTNAFTNQTTTVRDFKAATFLMENEMNLEIIDRFDTDALIPEQQAIFNTLFTNADTYHIDGLQIVIAGCEETEFQAGLATITEKLQDITAADAVITVVRMKHHIHIVGRASAERITLKPLLTKLGGGGHEQAGSAILKDTTLKAGLKQVTDQIKMILKPAMTAREIMASPVKTVSPETKIAEAGKLMFRYGHSGYPVVDDGKLCGMITRRDLDKANHHGLGHAPVKAYMSTNLITMRPETSLEEIQQLIIDHNIGRIPVVDDGKVLGIVTRTNIIEILHDEQVVTKSQKDAETQVLKTNAAADLKKQLPKEMYALLEQISKTAEAQNVSTYLIGGIVRDILLARANDDIDIVVEGDGIAFAKQLQADYGGNVVVHESFGTATWEHPSEVKIDVTSSRLEYYERPASLPDVEMSTLEEDLYRRDFTINAMAIRLNEANFGEIVDPFQGQLALEEKKIVILHNISFVEDPTRILRGVRFELRFKFQMDEETTHFAKESIASMKDLSASRIIEEMKKIFHETNQPAEAITRLYQLQFWQQFGVKESSKDLADAHARKLTTYYYKYKKLMGTHKPDWYQYFYMPFSAAAAFEHADNFAITKPTAKFLQEIKTLEQITNWQEMKTAGDLQRYVKDISDKALLYFVARSKKIKERIIITYITNRQQLQPLLTGADLIAQGLKPGTAFSKILLELEVEMLNEKITTKEAALTWLEEQASIYIKN